MLISVPTLHAIVGYPSRSCTLKGIDDVDGYSKKGISFPSYDKVLVELTQSMSYLCYGSHGTVCEHAFRLRTVMEPHTHVEYVVVYSSCP